MKIAFINHDLGPYGATRSLLDLIDGLTLRGVACFVIIPQLNRFVKEGPLADALQQRKVPYRAIDYRQWVHQELPHVGSRLKRFVKKFPNNRIYRAYKNRKAIPLIKDQLRQWDIDLVYTNTSVIPVGAIAAAQLNKPHVWHIREFQWIGDGLALDWGKRRFNQLISRSAAVILVSQRLKDYYASLIDLSESHVVYNGVASQADFDRAKRRRDKLPAATHPRYTFCILGRISAQKGQEEAIRALGILRNRGLDATLIVAGRGDYQSLEALSVRWGVQEWVTFLGHADDPFSVYAQSDACLVCSSPESFGRVTVEAMVAGLPVIGKKDPYAATQELIQDGDTGLLYEGDEEELAAAMKRLVKDPARGRTIGENGWRFAREHYHQEKYVDQVHRILQTIHSPSSSVVAKQIH